MKVMRWITVLLAALALPAQAELRDVRYDYQRAERAQTDFTASDAAVQRVVLAQLMLAQVTTNPSVTGVPAPQSAVAITGGTIDGAVIGGTTPAAITGTIITATTKVSVAAGTAANPSIVWTVDDDGSGTGLYRSTTNAIGFSANGAEIFRIQPTLVTAFVAITPSSTLGITGTLTNDNANTGVYGEYLAVTASPAAVTLSTGATSTVTSQLLTAGDWDCTGVINFTSGATTSYTNIVGGTSTTAATLGTQDTTFDWETAANIPTATKVMSWVVPMNRFSISASTTVYLVAQATFTSTAPSVGGTLRCRRMR